MLAKEEGNCELEEWLERCLETERWPPRQELWHDEEGVGPGERSVLGSMDAPVPNVVCKEEILMRHW